MHTNKSRIPPLSSSKSALQGNLPPPIPRQSSLPTWGEQMGSIQRNKPNAPGDSGTVANVTGYAVNHGGNISPRTNAQHGGVRDPTGTDHKIYYNQLLTKERGYPLWVPGPGMQLPVEYRRQGVSIGDVGIITPAGEFDFLFNILQPPEHAINNGLVPQGFLPISRRRVERDIQETTVYDPNTYLASSFVRRTGMKWTSETSVDQRFETAAKEAAILIMPHGATTQNLLNTLAIRDTISSNAKDWYTYSSTIRGRSIKNGDLRVVVGVDKVSSWGIATSACDTGQTASYVFRHDPTRSDRWDCTGGYGRVGPQKREIRDLIGDNGVPENQCVFVRTVNFTLSGRRWNDVSLEGVQQCGGPGYHHSASNNRGGPKGGAGSSGCGSMSSGYESRSTLGLHCDLELGVQHPSVALHNALHEKFPNADMVITEDMDWISVLNEDDVVFPEPEDLCERVLKAHQLHNHRGIVQIIRKDDPWRSSSSDAHANLSAEKDKDILKGSISSGIGTVGTSRGEIPRIGSESHTAPTHTPPARSKRQRIGRGLHPVDAPLTSPLKSRIKAVFRKPKKSLKSPSHPLSPTSSERAPIQVASLPSAHDDGGECPVCLQPLSLSFENMMPHIVPECGHALHEACFRAEYGPLQGRTLSNLGVCGVCRRPMKVAGGDGGRINDLTIMGMGNNHSSLHLTMDAPVTQTHVTGTTHDPSYGDPLVYDSSKSVYSEHVQTIVSPSIHVRSEFSSMTRTNEPNQPLTCVVAIELPGRRVPGNAPGPMNNENYGMPRSQYSGSSPSSPQSDNTSLHSRNHGLDGSVQNLKRQLSGIPYTSTSEGLQIHNYILNSLTPSEGPLLHAIAEDLRNRVADWKDLSSFDLGPLQMFDHLSVRRESAQREFSVYLFKEAILCFAGEKKKDPNSKGVLRLKGRVFVKHIKSVIASTTTGEMMMTIDVEDDMTSFVLIFKDRASLESWTSNIQALVTLYRAQIGMARSQEPADPETFGESRRDVLRGSGQSAASSQASPGSLMALQKNLALLTDDDMLSKYDSSASAVTPSTPSGLFDSFSPLEHPQMDLILVISLPPRDSLQSTAQLKMILIKSMLDFLVTSLGSKDRLSLVTFEVGMGVNVRKTPFLEVGRLHSRKSLEKFIDETGVKFDESEDEFLVRTSEEEKTDVVTAVNHGLDLVLQRKERNPVSGMILISDASDNIRREEIDLVLIRAGAANVPIHSFGYGRSHGGAPLWLISNHTNGTYTFVKDWYDLRGCVAGCVGGIMSIGLLNVKLQLKVVDSSRFRIRQVSGGPQTVLSADGQNVGVDVGELRYGEKIEFLIELELDNNDHQRLAQRHAGRYALNATDQFVHTLGLAALTIDEGPGLVDGMMNEMAHEVPVLEVDGSFLDPTGAMNITKLAHPVLLTIILLPGPQKLPSAVSDPVIVRRRMELLASEMIMRALSLVSRNNFSQAQKILGETKRVLRTVVHTITRPPIPHTAPESRHRREFLTLTAVGAMKAILQDLQLLSEALQDNLELFAHDQRNFGTQQAMILRVQKSWTGRSATERLFWTTDNSIELVSRSNDRPLTTGVTQLESPTSGSHQSSAFEHSEDSPSSDFRFKVSPHNWSLTQDTYPNTNAEIWQEMNRSNASLQD